MNYKPYKQLRKRMPGFFTNCGSGITLLPWIRQSWNSNLYPTSGNNRIATLCEASSHFVFKEEQVLPLKNRIEPPYISSKALFKRIRHFGSTSCNTSGINILYPLEYWNVIEDVGPGLNEFKLFKLRRQLHFFCFRVRWCVMYQRAGHLAFVKQ